MSQQTYSFLDVAASLSGPGAAGLQLGSGAGNDEEGITVEMLEDKATMIIGADGSVQHNLHAGKGGSVVIRLLKTSPVNQALSLLYAAQTAASSLYGQNVIVVTNVQRGDVISARACGFAKLPAAAYSKDPRFMEWRFNAGIVDMLYGSGQPVVG